MDSIDVRINIYVRSIRKIPATIEHLPHCLTTRVWLSSKCSIVWTRRLKFGPDVCSLVQTFAVWSRRLQFGPDVCSLVQTFAVWTRRLQFGPDVCSLVQTFAVWSRRLQFGPDVCSLVQTFGPNVWSKRAVLYCTLVTE